MKLWVISDLHCERRSDFDPPRPDFDVLVCAGDVHDDILASLGIVRALAGDKPAIFVAGNHEFFGDIGVYDTIHRGRGYAQQCHVHFLECADVDIGGVRFAGATLWDLHTWQHSEAVRYLRSARVDVVVTHFPPSRGDVDQVGAALWIYGHHHGASDNRHGRTRLIRNAIGYPNSEDELDKSARPAQSDFVVEI